MSLYSYRLEVFEGPLDLLLHLIEKHKINIYDIPIAEITDQYMKHLENWTNFDIHYGSEFLVMAATLLQIKSRLLLPRKPLDKESIDEDPRDELVEKLVEYKKIKEFTEMLADKAGDVLASYSRPAETSQWGVKHVYSFDANALYRVFLQAYEKLEEKVIKAPVISIPKESFSVENQIERIIEYTNRNQSLPLTTFLRQSSCKEEMVVTFIAILELLKRQILTIICEKKGEAERILMTRKEA